MERSSSMNQIESADPHTKGIIMVASQISQMITISNRMNLSGTPISVTTLQLLGIPDSSPLFNSLYSMGQEILLLFEV